MSVVSRSRTTAVAALLSALMLAFAAPGAGAAGLRVVNAWIEEGPPSVPVLAGYLVLENPTAQTVKLVTVRSPLAERIEIHRSDITEATATMTRIKELPLPARSKLAFSPAGYHLMIYGVEESPRAGARMPLELQTADGAIIKVDATVRRVDDGDPAMPQTDPARDDHQDH
jgi:periplasmic copper chaperone A